MSVINMELEAQRTRQGEQEPISLISLNENIEVFKIMKGLDLEALKSEQRGFFRWKKIMHTISIQES